MSDANLRELERRAYDSEEDFLRYSAARLRAGLGPIKIEVSNVGPHIGAAVLPGDGFASATIYLSHRNYGSALLLDESGDLWAGMLQENDGKWQAPIATAGPTRWGTTYGAAPTSTVPALVEDGHEAAAHNAAMMIRNRLRTHKNPPGRDDAIKGAFKEWQAGDDASLERLMAERARAGLTPKPRHPQLKVMEDAAKAAGWNGKKRMTGDQAKAALMHDLKRRGWRPDTHASVSLRVWISPDSQRRVTFGKKSVTWEKGGRGRWEKDYQHHVYWEQLSPIDMVAEDMSRAAEKPLTREEWTDPMQNPAPKCRFCATRHASGRSCTEDASSKVVSCVFCNRRHREDAACVSTHDPDLACPKYRSSVAGSRTAPCANCGQINTDHVRRNPSADERMRKLERAAKGGDAEAAQRLAHERGRAGQAADDWIVLLGRKLGAAGLNAERVDFSSDGSTVTLWNKSRERTQAILDFMKADGNYGTSPIYPVNHWPDGEGFLIQANEWFGEGSLGRSNPGGGRPMQNPPDKDVLYSLASLAQHGRTSSTIPALVKITGRPQHHVEQVVAALAQRGVVAVRGPLVIFDRRIVALVAGAPAVRKANPGAGVEVLPLKTWLKEAKSPSRYAYCGYSRVSDGEDIPCGTPPVYAVIHRAGVGKTYAMAVCGKHQSYGKKAISGSTRSNPGSDERLRALQRAAAAGGDEEASARLAHERARAGGARVRLTIGRDKDTREWRVNYWVNGKLDEGKSYITYDKQDAEQTRAYMQRRIDDGSDRSAMTSNPSPDERRRALQRQAQRELDTYGESAPDTLDRLTADAKRTEVPKLGDRAYLTEILSAWGIGEWRGGAVSLGAASAGLAAVFKKAGIRATRRSLGNYIKVSVDDNVEAEKLGRLFGQSPRTWYDASGVYSLHEKNVDVYPNKTVDRSDSMTDYFDPGGVTLPAAYFQTYAEGVQKALGSKQTTAQKKESKVAARKAAIDSAPAATGAPVEGTDYVLPGLSGVWRFSREVSGGRSGAVTLFLFTRVGKKGQLLSWGTPGNTNYISGLAWQKSVADGRIKIAPKMNPGMATLGWATNPGKGLNLAQARKRIGKADPTTLIAQTRPRDRDKLKAEIAHASRRPNPGPAVGRQKGGAWKTVSLETAIERYKIDKIPSFKKALAHYRKFHKADPHSVRICVRQNDDGKNKQMVVTDMGEVPETQYIVKDGKDSNKAGHHWVHKHREKGKGTNPQLVFDPVSGTMMIVGGTYKVTDWIRN